MMDSRVETLVMMRSVRPMRASSAGTKQPAHNASRSATAVVSGGKGFHRASDRGQAVRQKEERGRTDVRHERDERNLLEVHALAAEVCALQQRVVSLGDAERGKAHVRQNGPSE